MVGSQKVNFLLNTGAQFSALPFSLGPRSIQSNCKRHLWSVSLAIGLYLERSPLAPLLLFLRHQSLYWGEEVLVGLVLAPDVQGCFPLKYILILPFEVSTPSQPYSPEATCEPLEDLKLLSERYLPNKFNNENAGSMSRNLISQGYNPKYHSHPRMTSAGHRCP